MRTRCASDGLSYAIDDYTGALTTIATLPVRLWMRGINATLMPVFGRGRGRSHCGDPCAPDPCDPCPPACEPCAPAACEPCPPPACEPCQPCESSHCGCGNPGCSGCGHGGRITVGAEVETTSGLVGTVQNEPGIDDRHIVILSGGLKIKVTKKSVCKVVVKPLAVGDHVRTRSGLIGEVLAPLDDRVIKINSGGTTLQIDRKAICEIIPAAAPAARPAGTPRGGS